MKYLLLLIAILGITLGSLIFIKDKNIEVSAPVAADLNSSVILQVPEATSSEKTVAGNLKAVDIAPQKPLTDQFPEIKALYLTSWSAGSTKKIDQIIDMIDATKLNAVVIDIKDYSGYVAYDIKNPDVEKYGAKEIRIPKINSLIKKLHDQGIYTIARITIFQDPILANARPDLAIQNVSSSGIWHDNKGLPWLDPSSKEVWDYNIAIAKDAALRGFDELNFDYIRFASDGDLKQMKYPNWDGKTQKHLVIRNFFKYLRESLPGVKISADLFGLSTSSRDDLGIGQVIEDAYVYFDFISPMVYPSHYQSGTLGYKNPAKFPYEVIKYSMETALQRLNYCNKEEKNSTSTLNTTTTNLNISTSTLNASSTATKAKPKNCSKTEAKLRPWLQDFDLGADYNKEMIEKEVKAVLDSGLASGWMFWNPSNNYIKEEIDF